MKKWTKKEENYLRDNASQTNADIGQVLERSEDSVARKRRRLGVDTPEPIIDDVINASIKKENEKHLKKTIDVLTRELISTKNERDSFLGVGDVETYKIETKTKSDNRSLATAITLASDWHIEENVKSSQVNGLNSFNINIAKERAEQYFRVVSKLIDVHNKEYQIDVLILALLGDFISGSIHDDLKESNVIQPTEAIWEAQKLIASGIEYLLENTKVDLVIPCSSGNHGRMTDKQRTSTEYGNSLEILMYRQLEKYFKNEKRVKFVINDSYLTYVKVFNYTCRFHHGHALRYAGGIGGLFIPAYKAISQWNKQTYSDWDFFGHFHQLKDGANFISNGSLIGFNAYAVKIKADYEKPKQFFGIIDEQRGLEVTRKITL